MHVRQALLQYAKERGLDRRRKPLTRSREVQSHVNPAPFGEALDIPLRGGGKSYFIQQQRMQQVGRSANFFDRLIRQCCNLGHQAQGGRILFALFLKERNAYFQRCQRLASAIVQVASQLASLLILHLEKPL